MLVLDTSAVSAIMHGMPSALERLRSERPGDVAIVSPVSAEIRFGLERLPRGSRRRRLLEAEYVRLRASVRYEEWTEEAADEFGRQKARLTRHGTIVEDFDIAIGSIAVVLGARMATLNAKHLSRLQHLVVADWTS